MNIVERQTVVIYADLGTTPQSFSYDLDLEFTPDHVVVRDITYSAGGVLGVHAIIANFCRAKNNVIAVFDDTDPTPYHSNPETTYRIEHSSSTLTNGQITFQLRKINNLGSLTASVATGDLAITLEFQRTMAERKPEDIIIQSIDAILSKHIMARPAVYPFQLPNQLKQVGGQEDLKPTDSQMFMDPSIEKIPNVHPSEIEIPEQQEQPKPEIERRAEEKKE
jgi:hypothetical protein